MIALSHAFRFLAIGATLALCGRPAHATLYFAPSPSAVYQPGISATVRLGLVVQASSNLSRLVAGGSFDAHCMSPHTGHIQRSRELSSALIGRPNVLYVTIPPTLPAYLNMPGFESVERGRSIECFFDWQAYAEETSVTIGILGTSVTIAGERERISSSEPFTMDKPGTANGEDDTCIP